MRTTVLNVVFSVASLFSPLVSFSIVLLFIGPQPLIDGESRSFTRISAIIMNRIESSPESLYKQNVTV